MLMALAGPLAIAPRGFSRFGTPPSVCSSTAAGRRCTRPRQPRAAAVVVHPRRCRCWGVGCRASGASASHSLQYVMLLPTCGVWLRVPHFTHVCHVARHMWPQYGTLLRRFVVRARSTYVRDALCRRLRTKQRAVQGELKPSTARAGRTPLLRRAIPVAQRARSQRTEAYRVCSRLAAHACLACACAHPSCMAYPALKHTYFF